MKRTEIALLVSVALLFITIILVKLIPTNGSSSGTVVLDCEYEIGDTVRGFGSYNGCPLDWTVIDSCQDSLLLICTESIDIQTYDPSGEAVTWETCYLRGWLNDDFLNEAFTDEEQGMILTTSVPASPNPEYDTDPGLSTEDKIYLLSIDEVLAYFPDDESRRCPYHGLEECYWYWLRSPGISSSYAARVRSDGTVDCRGYMVVNRHAGSGVRPVMRVICD